MPEMMSKVRLAAGARQALGLGYRIEVDGGINATTASTSAESGADTFVCGTSVFGASDMSEAIRTIRQQCGSHRALLRTDLTSSASIEARESLASQE
jgi:ribulose-phosphate 3-epimerase